MVFSEQAATWRHVTFRTTWMLALLIIALQGCVILPIPTPEHGLLSGRGEITEADAASLEVGKTTREEVLLHLGEPSAILYDEQILIYQWSVVRCYLIWAVYGGAGDVSPIPKDYLLLLQFDVHGRLKRFDRTSPGLFESMAERVDKWTPPGSIKLADVERAADPRISETRGRFVINPVPNAESQPDSALAGVPSLRLKIEDFRDERAAGKAKLIGRRKAAFGVVTHDVYLSRRLSDVVRDAIASQWKAAGQRLVDGNQDVTVTGQIMEFKIETPVFPSWDAVGTLDVIIEVRAKGHDAKPIARRYHSQQVEKTVFAPSKKHFEAVILSCLQDLMHQMASDVDLARYVAGEQTHDSPNRVRDGV